MFTTQLVSGFCVFCYQSIYSCAKAANSSESVNKFTRHIERLTGKNGIEKLLKGDSEPEIFQKLKLQCCNECTLIIDGFCKYYHQFKVLELQMNWKLEQIAWTINHCNRVPSRWKTMDASLEETFPGDMEMKIRSQNVLRKYRQAIEERCRQRSLQQQPRVLLETNTNFITHPNITGQFSSQSYNEEDHIDNDVGTLTSNTSMMSSDMEYDQDISDSDKEDNVEYSNRRKSSLVRNPPMQFKLETSTVTSSPSEDADIELENDQYNNPHTTNISANLSLNNTSSLSPTNQQQGYSLREKIKFGRIKLEENNSSNDGSDEDFFPETNSNSNRLSTGENTDSYEYEDDRPAQRSASVKRSKLEISKCPEAKKSSKEFAVKKRHVKRRKIGSIDYNVDPGSGHWNCADCKLIFNLKKDLWMHQSKEHKHQVCLQCGKEFKVKSLLRQHLVYHKDPLEWNWECGKCEKKFSTKANLERHVRTHDNQNNMRSKFFKCSQCKNSFQGLRSYRRHIKSNNCLEDGGLNEDSGIFECLECDLICITKKDLWVHRSEEHETKVCIFCGREFNLKHVLARHLIYHKDPMEWEYECIGCGRKCATSRRLNEHLAACKIYKGMKKVTDMSIVKNEVTDKSKSDEKQDKMFRCSCLKAFKNHKIFENHKNSHIEGKFQCEFCPTVETNVLKLSTHEYQNHSSNVKNEQDQHLNESTTTFQWSCPRCQYKSTCCADYQFHFAQAHFKLCEEATNDPTTNSLTCLKCGKSFTQKVTLQNHLEAHKDKQDWKWKCDKCGKKFSNKLAMKKHLERHKDRKDWKWQCTKCGNKFIRKDVLEVHMRSHSNQKQFACEFCGKKFKYKASIKKHCKIYHENEKLKLANSSSLETTS